MKNLLLKILLLSANVVYAGFDEGKIAYDKEDYSTALIEFNKAAAQGSAEAKEELLLGNYLSAKDLKDAEQLLTQLHNTKDFAQSLQKILAPVKTKK